MQVLETSHRQNQEQLPLQDLERKGWAYLPEFFPSEVTEGLLEVIKSKQQQQAFHSAKIGKASRRTLKESIRLCETSWIDTWEASPYLKCMNLFLESFMTTLNAYFFLSMKSWESQFAAYPEGGFYKKHIDQLKGGGHRQVTLILYLNDCDQGGELVIFDRENKNKEAYRLLPKVGACAVFFSSQIYHEVLPTQGPRYSLTTWFRDDIL